MIQNQSAYEVLTFLNLEIILFENSMEHGEPQPRERETIDLELACARRNREIEHGLFQQEKRPDRSR
jgi:hypothetical protein